MHIQIDKKSATFVIIALSAVAFFSLRDSEVEQHDLKDESFKPPAPVVVKEPEVEDQVDVESILPGVDSEDLDEIKITGGWKEYSKYLENAQESIGRAKVRLDEELQDQEHHQYLAQNILDNIEKLNNIDDVDGIDKKEQLLKEVYSQLSSKFEYINASDQISPEDKRDLLESANILGERLAGAMQDHLHSSYEEIERWNDATGEELENFIIRGSQQDKYHDLFQLLIVMESVQELVPTAKIDHPLPTLSDFAEHNLFTEQTYYVDFLPSGLHGLHDSVHRARALKEVTDELNAD